MLWKRNRYEVSATSVFLTTFLSDAFRLALDGGVMVRDFTVTSRGEAPGIIPDTKLELLHFDGRICWNGSLMPFEGEVNVVVDAKGVFNINDETCQWIEIPCLERKWAVRWFASGALEIKDRREASMLDETWTSNDRLKVLRTFEKMTKK